MLTGLPDFHQWTSDRARDYCGGAALIAIGLGTAWTGFDYGIGSLTEMGAGFFPAALGCILAGLGLIIALGASRVKEQAPVETFVPEWRGWSCIILSVVAFIFFGTHCGLLPATFAIVFISAMGDRRNTVKSAILLAAGISILALVVFWWALRVQMPLLTWTWS